MALLHGCALLRIVPSPKTCGDFLTLAAQSGLPLDLPEIATVLWSLVQLAQPEPAVELLNSLPADVQEQIVTSDAQSLCLLVWSLLTLRQHEHFLLQPTLVALVGMGAGLKQLAQLCLLAESALMLQLEVPPALGLDGHVGVMVARHHRHPAGVTQLTKRGCSLFELLLEGHVCQITGHDHVIRRLLTNVCVQRREHLGAVAPAAAPHPGLPAPEPLRRQLPRLRALERRGMPVREMSQGEHCQRAYLRPLPRDRFVRAARASGPD